MDETELTAGEAFAIRRAAALLIRKLGERGLGDALIGIADAGGAADICECCLEPARCTTADDVRLCECCMDAITVRAGQVWQRGSSDAWVRLRVDRVDDDARAHMTCVEVGPAFDGTPPVSVRMYVRLMRRMEWWTLHQDAESGEEVARG